MAASKATPDVVAAVDTAADDAVTELDPAVNAAAESVAADVEATAAKLIRDTERHVVLAEREVANYLRARFGHHPEVAEALAAGYVAGAQAAAQAITTTPTSGE